MKLPVVTIEGNIGARITTLLERFEHSLPSEDKCKIKINHESVDVFQKFWGNDMNTHYLTSTKTKKKMHMYF